MKKIFLFLTIVSFSLLIGIPLSIAQDVSRDVEVAVEVSEPQDVGNKICPVSGEKIDENTKVTYEYEGKIYNFCCKACMKDFKKDPDKYIKKVEEELKKRAEQEKKAMPTPEMPEGMSEGHHHPESHQEHQH